MLWTIHQRGNLGNFKAALQKGTCTTAYYGGSITDGAAQHNWPHFVDHWLVARYPEVRFSVENIALGATGSDIALMRCARDILPTKPDLCFIEFAVNDNGYPTEYRTRTREGLLRQMLASGRTDVVVVYTFSRDFREYMVEGKMPPTIAEFEELCENYNVSSVWMSAYTFEMVRRGELRVDEWLPDYLHPQYAGARQYAAIVCELLKQETETDNPAEIRMGDRLPAPVNAKNYEALRLVPWEDVSWKGPVYLERCQRYSAVNQFLSTSAPEAEITVTFEGTGLIMAEQFGSDTCEYAISVDGGEPVHTSRERPAWAGKEGWLRTERLCEDLPYGKHTVTLKTEFCKLDSATGILTRIGMFAAV